MMQEPEQRRGENLYPVKFAAQFGDHELNLDCPEGVWNPTPHGVTLGKMLLQLDFTGDHVLELGTGCGIHAILLARRGAKSLKMTEIDSSVLECARHNLAKHEVTIPQEYLVADWTSVGGDPCDSLVTNPPFAKSGKRYLRYFIDRLILDAHKLLRPGGRVVFVQSSMADTSRTVGFMEENGMAVRVVGEVEEPFREYYFEDPSFMREIAQVPGGYTVREGVHYERLIVLEGTLPG